MNETKKEKKGQYKDGSPIPAGTQVADATQGNGEGAAAKPTETKREKFLRLARRRVPKAVKAMQQCGNLLRKGQYDYEEQHARRIIKVLSDEIVKMELALKGAQAAAPIADLFADS